jgi:TolB-like protein/Flp pilus assembly protein TadD
MPEGVEGSRKVENAHILIIGLVGHSDLPGDRRRQELDELDRVVRSGTRFRVTEVAGKVFCCRADDGMVLAFLGGAEAAIECATEIAAALKDHPKIKFRMGMHGGQVVRDAAAQGEVKLSGEGAEVARAVMEWGDAGHILLSKRIAYDLAPVPRWNEHLYELDDSELKSGRKSGLVNFYTDAIGNRQVPAKIKRQREQAARAARLRRLRVPVGLAAGSALFLLAVIAGVLSLHRRLANIPPAAPPARSPGKSLAVLPFIDLSRARDQEFFCDGVSDEIRNTLAKANGLEMIARNSSLVFKGPNADLNEAAQKLDVQNILKGSLHRDGSWVRLSTQLVNARSGIETWSKTYDGQLSELPSVEEQIARSVASVLKVDAPAATPAPGPRDVLVYDLYLQGLFLSHKNSEDELRAGLDFFRLVLDKDPELEPVFTGTARIWLRLADGFIPPLNAYPQAQSAAEKAVALREDDAEAHALLGEAKRIFDWDLKGEEAELKRALQIDPNSVPAHLLMAKLKTDLGDSEESLVHMRRAVRLDPLSPVIGHLQVSIDVANDRLNEALAATKRTMEIDPDYIYFEPDLALVYREQGKLRQALDIYLRLRKTRHRALPGLAITYARLGKKEEARKVLGELIQAANTRYVPAEQVASVFVALGDNQEAFRWLNRAVDEHSATIHEVGNAPEFRALRSDPRFADILRRIGLDPAKFPVRLPRS